VQFGGSEGGSPTKLLTVDLATGRRSVARLRSWNLTGDLLWLDDQRVTFLSGGGDYEDTITFDAGLDRRLARFDGWGSRGAALEGNTVWSIDFGGRLLHARLPDGPARVVRVLPYTEAYPVLALPQRPAVRASRRVPRG
jgi:hypothetical protein